MVSEVEIFVQHRVGKRIVEGHVLTKIGQRESTKINWRQEYRIFIYSGVCIAEFNFFIRSG